MEEVPGQLHIEWTDKGGGQLVVGGHLLPYSAATISHDARRLPTLTVMLPLRTRWRE